MRRIFFIALVASQLLSLSTPISARAECTNRTCVEVHVKDGKIVIEGKRDGSSNSVSSTKRESARATSKVTIRPTSKTTIRPTIRPSAKPTLKPRVRRSSSSTPALSDRILQSLPTLQVAYQPEGAVLTRVPVVFFTDLPVFFNKTYRILGVPVRIDVRPVSLWRFGDGSVLVTDKPGRPYPARDITHSYSVPGRYLVEVESIWSGTYTIAGITQPLDGVIRQLSAVDVKVVGADTKFVGK